MKLVQILIESGIIPDDLHPDCEFIAQDSNYRHDIYFYDVLPKLRITYGIYCLGGIHSQHVSNKDLFLAEDWQTPLSRTDFVAAYEEHVNGK